MSITFTSKKAEQAAAVCLLKRTQNKEYIEEVTYVVVGIDNNHLPFSVYARPLPLPDVFINTPQVAIDLFQENPNHKNEFLICFDILEKKIQTLFKPETPLILSTPWERHFLN